MSIGKLTTKIMENMLTAFLLGVLQERKKSKETMFRRNCSLYRSPTGLSDDGTNTVRNHPVLRRPMVSLLPRKSEITINKTY